MHFSTSTATAVIATAALTFTTLASAQQIYVVDRFSADDKIINQGAGDAEYELHLMDFNISRPNAVPQQGGDGVFHCRVEWQGCEPKTCYTPCTATEVGNTNSQYWTRVTPGAGRKKAVDISVDLLQYYSYRNSVVQNGTFGLKKGETGSYACETNYYRGTLTEWCELKEEPKTLDVDVEVFGYGIYPIETVAEICS